MRMASWLVLSLWLIRDARAQQDTARQGVASEGCRGDPYQKLLLGHDLNGSVNPLTVSTALRLTLCTPLSPSHSWLLRSTRIDLGLVTLASPNDAVGGVFVRLVPLSFLVLRAE